MNDPLTSVLLAVLTLVSILVTGVSLYSLAHPLRKEICDRVVGPLLWVMTLGVAGVFVYRWTVVTGQWLPLTAHVDGLVLIGLLLCATVLFIHSRKRLFGLTAFAMPILTVFLAWSVCASAWTYRPFEIETLHPVWKTVHLTGVYLGTLSAGVAAMAGAMFLYVQGQLKRKRHLARLGRLTSLETLEQMIILTSTCGFALLSLGLASGAIIISDAQEGQYSGWFWAKIAVSTVAWVVYALLMNLRFNATFRGARAAWLSLIGLALLLGVYGVVNVIGHLGAA